MTVKTANFIEDWFFDSFCRMSDVERDEFIKRLWGLYRCTNEKDVEICKSKADENLDYKIDIDDIRDLLSDYAHDVIYELYCDNLLPDKYISMYKYEMNGLQ